MSLLEDLKKEAEAKKEKELEAQRRQEQALEEFRTEVRPRLAQVFTYLSELVEHLNFVHPDIQVSYAIKNYANLENLRQSGYTVHADNQGDLKSISLSCECTGDRKVGFEVTSEALMTRETDYLREVGLTFARREHRGERRNITGASFKIEPKVPVVIRFDLADDMRGIVLTVSNLDVLETRRYRLPYQKIDRAFLEELGKAVLRQPNAFLRLDISPDDRQKLRQQLDRPTRKRLNKVARPEWSVVSGEPPAPKAPEVTPDEPVLATEDAPKVAGSPAPRPTAGPPEAETSATSDARKADFARAPTPYKAVGRAETEADAQLAHLAELQRSPLQLLEEARRMLTTLNRIAFAQPGRRLHYSEAIVRRIYPALAGFYAEFAGRAGGLPEDEYRRAALSACVSAAEQLAISYAQALRAEYSPTPDGYAKVRERVVLCGFRMLELTRVEQRLRALRYQKMPAAAWLDCNRVFFLLAEHNDLEEQLRPMGQLEAKSRPAASVRADSATLSPRDLFLSIQLFGFLDLTMWPAQLFRVPDAYLEAARGKVRILSDDGADLVPGRLLTYLDNDKPAQGRRPARVTAPLACLDYTELFALAVRDRTELDKMSFIARFDPNRVSRVIASLDELDRMPALDLILHSLTQRERTQTRRAVWDDQRLHVDFGFNESYRMLEQTTSRLLPAPERATVDRARSQLTHRPSNWSLLNFSAGGLLIATVDSDLPRAASIGDVVAFAPVDKAQLPLIGYVARLQHPGDREVQVAIVRLSRYAEAASIQASDNDRIFEQAAILVQDLKNQWRLIVPPDYGLVTGSPIKLVRASGKAVPARLGDVRLNRPEFVVFDVRSPGLETSAVDLTNVPS